jgi:hypothetical protein
MGSSRRLVLILAASWALLLGQQSWAHATQYSSLGDCVFADGTPVTAYGTMTKMYTYPRPANLAHDWVNSIYAGTALGSFYEAGWYWTPGASYPAPFSHFYNYVTNRGSGRPLSTTLTPGTWAWFSVQNVSGTSDYQTYISGVLKDTWRSTGITSEYPYVGAERYDVNTVNAGSWTYCQYWKQSGGSRTWTYWSWSAPESNVAPPAVKDPTYWVHGNHIGDANHWCYSSDHYNL